MLDSLGGYVKYAIFYFCLIMTPLDPMSSNIYLKYWYAALLYTKQVRKIEEAREKVAKSWEIHNHYKQ